MISSMVEGIVGDQLKKKNLHDYIRTPYFDWSCYLGSDYVEVTRKDNSTQSIDVDLMTTYTKKIGEE